MSGYICTGVCIADESWESVNDDSWCTVYVKINVTSAFDHHQNRRLLPDMEMSDSWSRPKLDPWLIEGEGSSFKMTMG